MSRRLVAIWIAIILCAAVAHAADAPAGATPAPDAAALPAASVLKPIGGDPCKPNRLPAVTGPLQLTPLSAVVMAVQRSTDLAITQEQINLARGVLREARSITQPRVQALATYTRSGPSTSIELPPEFGGGSIEFAPTSQHRESLEATVPLYLGGRGKYAVASARAGIEAAEQDVQAQTIQLGLGAGLAAYRILRLQQLVIVSEQRVTAVAEHLRIAQAMFEAGTVPRFEVVQAETELARARGDVIHARTAVANQEALLRQLLVVPQDTELKLTEGVPMPMPEGDRYALIEKGLRERPEIPALQARIRSREAGVRLARANRDISLALTGHLNNQTQTSALKAVSWDVSLGLTVPLYQGDETKGRVEQAESRLATECLNLERTQQQIALQVTQASLAVQDAQESLTVAEQGEREARDRLNIAQVRFSNGVSLGVEVLDAQVALASAQTAVINARYDLQVATMALWGAIGAKDIMKEPLA